MSKINGIYAASMSILNDDLTLNAKRTISHAEKLIDQGCHGIAVFGSTGQAQLIPISEKIDLLNHLTKSKYKEKFIIGTGLNSLGETINLMNVSNSLNFKKFLIMPPAFYKFGDKDVINYYTKIIDANPESEIILYNFEKYNLISALHSYYSKTNGIYKNVLPPLSILKSQDEKDLINELEKLNFLTKSTMVA